jgi:type VI secretion system protein ImpG
MEDQRESGGIARTQSQLWRHADCVRRKYRQRLTPVDPRLLEYYNAELAYLRELAQEFAEQHPKIAARLGMNGIEVADPYVERLLQGFSFLTARIQLKMDAQFPHFSQRLLEVLHPHYLAPTPSMAIVQLRPRMTEGSLDTGFLVPRNSPMSAGKSAGESTACEFRTAHDVTLWPLEIVDVSCTPAPSDLPLTGRHLDRPVKGALCIRLKSTKGMLAQLNLDQLTFYLAGPDDIASRLYEAIFAHSLAVVGCETKRPVKWMEFLQPETIRPEGFDSNQALLPYDSRAFQGHRLLHEYFALPARFRFFTLTNLKHCLSKTKGNTLDLTILLDCPLRDLENLVDKQQLALFCTPVVNLFPKRSGIAEIKADQRESHIIADRNKPQDFEIYSVSAAFGQETGGGNEQKFHSFFTSLGSDVEANTGFYSIRRESHLLSEASRRGGARTNYVGSEVFLALVDRNQAPLLHSLKSISVEALCTNRDLASSMPLGNQTDFHMQSSVPVEVVKILCGPTEPKKALADGVAPWSIISHLDVNYLTLSNHEDGGAQALRELLSIYAPLADLSVRKHINAISSINLKGVTKRLPAKGHILMGRGVGVDITVDETLFAGVSPYLLGSVLEQFFPRHVGQNSFTETVLQSLQRGEIGQWKLRMGMRPIA